jgi:hypothetical protein
MDIWLVLIDAPAEVNHILEVTQEVTQSITTAALVMHHCTNGVTVISYTFWKLRGYVAGSP